MRKRKPAPCVVVISDTHFGCRLALCGDAPVKLDDGGYYHPSAIQKVLTEKWSEFWGEWVPRWTKGEPYAVVHNGDVVEGAHHKTTSTISNNVADQGELAHRMLKPIVEAADGRYYQIRGTEAHVGQQGVDEEQLAKRLGAIPNAEGQYARWDLRLQVGGGIVHLLHHIGTTGSANYETTALCSEFVDSCNEAARWGYRPPDVVVRSHRHRHSKVELPTHNGTGISVTTPAWQLKTPYTWRLAGARLSPPQIGGIIIRQGDRGLFCASKTWTMPPSSLESA